MIIFSIGFIIGALFIASLPLIKAWFEIKSIKLGDFYIGPKK